MSSPYTLSVDDRRRPSAGIIRDLTADVQQFAKYASEVLPDIEFALENGTGVGAANQWYLARRTLAGTTFDLLDLSGGLTDFRGATIAFTKIKRVLVAVIAPDGTTAVQVGPQNQTHAWVGPWGGVGAADYLTVIDYLDLPNRFAGWTVTNASTDILPIFNPGSSPVTYAIWIIGEQLGVLYGFLERAWRQCDC